MSEPSRDEVREGTAVYTPEWLARYDAEVLGTICRDVWRCDVSEMQEMYDRDVGDRHLDLGPGTGLLLDDCVGRRSRIALVDLNRSVLTAASHRLQRFELRTFERDVLSPFDLDGERFDSAGLNFLLHCLPGGMAHKTRVLDHARAHVVPGGRIFGSTVLDTGVAHTDEAINLLDELNGRGTFHNSGDALHDLDTELANRFADYHLTVCGSVALFGASA